MPRIRLPSPPPAADGSKQQQGSSEAEPLFLSWVDDWRDEPRHSLVFENAFTRIYRARFEAGAACETAFHRHREDTVYACISSEGAGGVVINTEVVLDEATQQPVGLLPPARVAFTTGLCFCHLNKGRNRIHRIQTLASNTGTLEFVGAEVLSDAGPLPLVAGAPLAPLPPHYSLEDAAAAQHPKARAYRVAVPPGGRTGPVEWRFCGVVIVLRGRPEAAAFGGQEANKGPGDAWWFEGPLTVDIAAGGEDGEEGAELLVVEWT